MAKSNVIALYRDESKLYRFRDAQTSKSSIDIYTYSGKLISRINVSHAVLSYVWRYEVDKD